MKLTESTDSPKVISAMSALLGLGKDSAKKSISDAENDGKKPPANLANCKFWTWTDEGTNVWELAKEHPGCACFVGCRRGLALVGILDAEAAQILKMRTADVAYLAFIHPEIIRRLAETGKWDSFKTPCLNHGLDSEYKEERPPRADTEGTQQDSCGEMDDRQEKDFIGYRVEREAG